MLLLQLQLLLLSHALGNAATATKATTAGACTGNANTATTASSAKSCTGNSATASKLATARNIKLQGAISGNANFDGSANITINTSLANVAVLTGTITSAATDTGVKTISIKYPTGYNQNNCIVIGTAIDIDNSTVIWGTGATFTSTSYVRGSLPMSVALTASNIEVEIRNINILVGSNTLSVVPLSGNYKYKIVLMKI